LAWAMPPPRGLAPPWTWSPLRGGTQDKGRPTLDRTFYGPHQKPPKCPPALAWAMPPPRGLAPPWTWSPLRGGTQDKGRPTLDRTFYGPHLEPAKCLPALGLVALGTPGMAPPWTWGQAYWRPMTTTVSPWTGRYSCRPVETGAIRRRSKSGHSKVRTPLPENPHQHSIPGGYVRSSGFPVFSPD